MTAAVLGLISIFGRTPWQVYAAGAIMLAAWLGADHIYERGRADCEADIKAAAFAERTRQAAANQVALKTGAEIVSELSAENDRLKTTLMEIADAARTHPDSDACGLGSDSLRLLDRIGGQTDARRSAGGPHPGL
ncbi:hypothetical protein [Amorphus orientalis]|uniref:Uncharacterized protein n=1 Tax=Amorphus orientalis TaxID=649198 RepID=A0AAE3VU35_9HYPH|nr:hypothetical protein [Amorphus orientalis]MDQ0317823.1 hypothetical protein [Amorphus orientalis]